MTAAAAELNFSELKHSRDAQRNKSLLKDRENYQRALAKRTKTQAETTASNGTVQKGRRLSSVPVAYSEMRPHRAARTVLRSWLAKGEVKDETDVPTVSIGHVAMHKPSASRLHILWQASQKSLRTYCNEADSDAETSLPESADVAEDIASERASPTLSFVGDDKVSTELAQATMLPEAMESKDYPTSESMASEADSLELETASLAESVEDDEVSSACLQSIKEKADRALLEAAAIRDQVHVEAQLQFVTRHLMKVERMKAEAEAETQALKLQAEKERVAVANAQAQVEAMHAEAEQAARLIRESALADAVALRSRAFSQLKEKVDAESKAHEEAKEKLAREAEARVQHETATALKLAKTMEQQRARKFRKQAEQERLQEQKKSNELKGIEAQVEEEKQAIIAAARAEAQEEAQAEVAAVRAQAERVADALKAKLASDTEELIRQAEAAQAQALLALSAPMVGDEATSEKDNATEDSASPELENDWLVLSDVEDPNVDDSDWDVLV